MLSVGRRCDVVHVKSRMLIQQLEQVTFLLPLDVSGVTSGYVYLLQDPIIVGKPRERRVEDSGKHGSSFVSQGNSPNLYLDLAFSVSLIYESALSLLLICHLFCVLCY